MRAIAVNRINILVLIHIYVNIFAAEIEGNQCNFVFFLTEILNFDHQFY